jgi:hypothetical protein
MLTNLWWLLFSVQPCSSESPPTTEHIPQSTVGRVQSVLDTVTNTSRSIPSTLSSFSIRFCPADGPMSSSSGLSSFSVWMAHNIGKMSSFSSPSQVFPFQKCETSDKFRSELFLVIRGILIRTWCVILGISWNCTFSTSLGFG